ncbi:aconitate hydratase AcnA [Thermodesulforhabdus norvegica]|uniref:Aconitate hydratase n=1 Tax=Thermodesulforhabdus norvegica TaxID=39841 RepID=A0A1I4QF80_9BACT|nr:aconitate hydratase AcnA [Thermodesulforhabdus norvegica]SFM38677.1 aconitase [Thermodesulforhabdus norvegica]
MNVRTQIEKDGEVFEFIDLKGLCGDRLNHLPYSIRILLENLLRRQDGKLVKEHHIEKLVNWKGEYKEPVEIPFFPTRVLMQDFTGVPAVADLAAMRDAMLRLGKDPGVVNPMVPVDLVADHSVQVDFYGTADAFMYNTLREYERNKERYRFLKWAQKSFDNFRMIPPGSGICHQINLEYLSKVFWHSRKNGRVLCFPDSVVGLDSHTTMVNGIGVLGWGVGGIEAEAVLLGQPCFMTIPQVIGVRLVGKLPEGTTATDLVLRITRILRDYGVVEKFVEFFGPALKDLPVPTRTTIANMSPEYGATVGFFPVDRKVVEFLYLTGRRREALITERVAPAMGLYYTGEENPEYSDVIEVDLSATRIAVAGPSRPMDRVELPELKKKFAEILGKDHPKRAVSVHIRGETVEISDGSVVIAAITSCTNTSNPQVLIGAALLARNAVKKGLKVPGYVKTSFAPGSRVVISYLHNSGLLPYLEALGFHAVAYGCTTCIGNSGPLHPEVEKAVEKHNLNVVAVLSGNRNFEARIHQKVKSNFLASPVMVVAFALAGRVDIDFEQEPLGMDPNGMPVYLADILPDDSEIDKLVRQHIISELYEENYKHIVDGDELWKNLSVEESVTYPWDPKSTYIQRPPFFDDFSLEVPELQDIRGARVLLWLGDSVTTDHISPAGAIPEDYPAGQFLKSFGITPDRFNSYGARRGNHEVMMRGTFSNIRIRNKLVSESGGFTVKFPEKKKMFVFDAAEAYRREGVPLIVLGGKEYGTGSSRDWAAKGPKLLGVKAVIAQSFERIHRSNLIGMGILPLQFEEGQSAESLGLDGTEEYHILGVNDIKPRKKLMVKAISDGKEKTFYVVARLDTDVEVDYYRNGGILNYVLRKIAVTDCQQL